MNLVIFKAACGPRKMPKFRPGRTGEERFGSGRQPRLQGWASFSDATGGADVRVYPSLLPLLPLVEKVGEESARKSGRGRVA